MAFLLEIVSLEDQIAAEDEAADREAEREEMELYYLTEMRERYMMECEAEAAKSAKIGDEADDEPLPETRILRPWHQNKSFGPWGPKGRKAKRKTLRSHRTGR